MRVVGLMSGTSADGIDAVLAEIKGTDGPPQMRQLAFETVPWPPRERDLIGILIAGHGGTHAVSQAGFLLGEQFAKAVLRVVKASGLGIEEVDLIGSHGQTVWHEVAEDGAVHSTLQIGEAAVIAERTGITTVADYRVAGVAAGGQGAPLIPIFDRLFLKPPVSLGGCRAVQNIGGIGNVTFLPPAGSDASIQAFDTGPGNVLIDWAAARATEGALRFDKDGELAARGRCDDKLVERWLEHPYFQQPPPKSTGRELFSSGLAERYRLEAAEAGLSMADFTATVTELTAASIGESYRRFAPLPVKEVVVCGGGARNPVLMDRIESQVALRCGRDVSLLRYGDMEDAPGDEESKEALGFALLAWLTVHGEGGNVPETTGARAVRVLGKISPGRNYRRLMAGL
ncbi:MAG: anhydro-N-acetylmuramic acid kinase [Caldilineaceae bacterium SB0664_bin_27]|uniref:Anhydro-N-acetylmuramic acid kinase n=1 Tax=Caldilineaceae bacterium SB0664_bin_27 TaxID=2605260 RepID=A0A6B0YX16_9CHLR|nr:anhydro-N-acetylmuramic acid kinase [Caldilineaceae bacterium SB0664_bin_27]